jgi:hypothetical protein
VIIYFIVKSSNKFYFAGKPSGWVLPVVSDAVARICRATPFHGGLARLSMLSIMQRPFPRKTRKGG